MEWPLVTLERVVLVNPKDDDHKGLSDDTLVSFVPMSAVSEDGFGITERFVKRLGDVRRGYSAFKNDDVLFAKITPCMENGKSAIATGLENARGFGSTEFHVLRTGPTLLPDFLYYFLRQKSFRLLARQHMRGGAGQQRVPADFLQKEVIPLPTLSEQRRIVGILDQAERIRHLRADADAKADRILPALFIKMFGDPRTNPMGWPVKPLGEIGELDRGRSRHRPRNDPALLGGSYPLIQTGDIANSGGRITQYTQTYSELGLGQSKMWPAGTLCITIAANIANTGVLEFDACFPDSVVGFVPGADTTTEYVQFLLTQLQRVLEAGATQVAQKNINLKMLRSLVVPVPPIDLQNRFSMYVHKQYACRAAQALIHEKLDRLFASATSRAFTGDLTASWREAYRKELLQEMEQQKTALKKKNYRGIR